MDPGELALLRSWLSRAVEDLDSAEALEERGSRCFGSALFHCQQAAEKALKAYLSYQGTPFQKTHDLSVLLDVAADTTLALEPLRLTAETLTPYAVVYRYPSTVAPPTPEQVVRAREAARQAIMLVLSLLPSEISAGFEP